jgi:single-strand DNA-binding protein
MPNQHTASAGKSGEHLNTVHLRGRLAATPTPRELPSGDELWGFRLTVARPAGERGRVDSIDCSTTRARVQRVLERASRGDTLEVTGALRRRFWRATTGLASRYEVEVSALARVGRTSGSSMSAAGKPAGPSPTARPAARRRSGA